MAASWPNKTDGAPPVDVLSTAGPLNVSDSNVGKKTSPENPLIVLSVPALMFASGVIGNVLALIVLYRSKRDHRRSVFYRLVGGLAFTDLFGTMALSPVTLLVYSNGRRWVGGDHLCHYFSFMMIFAGKATVFIVGAMALERYLAIIHPYAYAAKFSPGKVKYILLGIWMFAGFIACLPLVGLGHNVRQFPGTWCFFDSFGVTITDKIFTYFYASLGLLVIGMTALCNATVMCVLMRMRHVAIKLGTYGRKIQVDNEVQMIILLAGIILVFATCYAPLMVRVIINQTGTLAINHSADLWVIRLACLNQILDPWVYILFRKELFTKIWGLLHRLLCPQPEQTTPAAMMKDEYLNNFRPLTAAKGEQNNSPRGIDKTTNSPKLQFLKDLTCCSSPRWNQDRKGSGRTLLISTSPTGNSSDQAQQWPAVRPQSLDLIESPAEEQSLVRSDVNETEASPGLLASVL